MMISLLLFLFIHSPLMQSPTVNEHVKLETSIQLSITPQSVGTVSFTFTPLEGIHVNTTPNIELKLEKNSLFEIVGKPKYSKTDKDYLDISKPVIFTLSAKKELPAGKSVLKGKLNYYYCSDKDGWCNRFTQPVEMTIEIAR